ncbi:hypothetical protein MTO96_015126 [Rhipicephalus appendiculatus]
MDQYNHQLFGTGRDGSSVFTAGFYGYQDATGLNRQMNYADAMQGFRASFGNVGASELRTTHGVSNTAAFNTAPTIRPVPTGSPQEAAAVAYGPRTAPPNTGGHGAYDRTTADPYAVAARAFEYAQYRTFRLWVQRGGSQWSLRQQLLSLWFPPTTPQVTSQVLIQPWQRTETGVPPITVT